MTNLGGQFHIGGPGAVDGHRSNGLRAGPRNLEMTCPSITLHDQDFVWGLYFIVTDIVLSVLL